MKAGHLMGRLSNGWERDRGRVIHALPDTCKQYDTGAAACGAVPGRRSGGWDVDHAAGREISCPRCLRRLRASGEAKAQPAA